MSGFPMLSWRDDEPGNYGPGVSRPAEGESTREFRLLIEIPGERPFTWITQAPTQRHVIKYAKNRWPNATCSVLK